ncbi:MAG: hypothetical protein AAGA77_10265, partial [Bacteroidota bacterium]
MKRWRVVLWGVEEKLEGTEGVSRRFTEKSRGSTEKFENEEMESCPLGSRGEIGGHRGCFTEIHREVA